MYRGMRQYKIFFFAIVFFIVIANFLFLFSIRRNLKEILLRQGYHDSFEMIERTRCLGRECFQFRDLKSSSTVDIVISEIPSDYEIINKIQFSKGDTIIDIGAHVGVVSAYIGRLNPNIKIYAIEAVPLNYQNLVYNLKINNINNVNPVANALYDQNNKEVNLCFTTSNSGGSGICSEVGSMQMTQETVTLDTFVVRNKIQKIKLLKIDCEGCEFQVFKVIKPETLNKIEYVVGEVHINREIETQIQNKTDIPEYIQIIDKLKPHISVDKIFLKVVDKKRQIP